MGAVCNLAGYLRPSEIQEEMEMTLMAKDHIVSWRNERFDPSTAFVLAVNIEHEFEEIPNDLYREYRPTGRRRIELVGLSMDAFNRVMEVVNQLIVDEKRGMPLLIKKAKSRGHSVIGEGGK
ncbi:hypothetical protein LCGC14_1634290 [marine sediment metagenome]|uniref:Uncharacterized protein n=1 Tax=marine sediment metagenome TaxID=412755 RepID=A0A0F9L1C5_9ZZZZ